MTASPLTLDDLARHAEVEAQVLRAVSPLGIEQASQLLLALVGKIRGDRRPIHHIDFAPTDQDRQSPDPREAPLLREPDDGLNDLRERLAAPDKRRTRVKPAALPEPEDVGPRKYTFPESKPKSAQDEEFVEVDDEPADQEEPPAGRPLRRRKKHADGKINRAQLVREIVAQHESIVDADLFPLVAKAMGEEDDPVRSRHLTRSIVVNLVIYQHHLLEEIRKDGSRVLRLSRKGRGET